MCDKIEVDFNTIKIDDNKSTKQTRCEKDAGVYFNLLRLSHNECLLYGFSKEIHNNLIRFDTF